MRKLSLLKGIIKSRISKILKFKQKNADVLFFENAVCKITPQPFLSYLTIGLAEHCNLNCAYCDHFSPLAEEKFYTTEIYKKDIERLSVLSSGNIKKIALEGGEPLLNPNINFFIKETRKYFPKSEIVVITNGLLMLKMGDDFYSNLKKNNITILMTKYPIKLDYEKIKEKLKKLNINYKFYNTGFKTSHKFSLDLKGEQNPRKSFIKCHLANNCVYLKNGKLYTCTLMPNVEHFNKYFNKNLDVKNNGIDIYKANSMKEILSDLAKPIEFCKYCNLENFKTDLNWRISKKEIEEWT